MFGWVREQVKEHGVLTATRVVGQVVASKTVAAIANKYLPSAVMCPCCGWRGRRFHDYIEAVIKFQNRYARSAKVTRAIVAYCSGCQGSLTLKPGEVTHWCLRPRKLGTRTDEFGYPDPKQSGHWRMYGDDFEERLG